MASASRSAELIGRGTCSTVFRARDELLDRDVAVKIFPVTDDPRIAREVSLLASLDHPALVPRSTTSARSTAARSSSWRCSRAATSPTGWRRRPADPVAETLLAGAAVADALAHVHRAGVLHRDVIPRNVLFDADGRAHLSDFGVALVADAPRITDTGIVVGLRAVPRARAGPRRGRRAPADVYALGLVMIEALTARPAYDGAPLAGRPGPARAPAGDPRGPDADVSP